jgi:hypothetical protein
MNPNHAESLSFLKWWLPSGPWCLAAIHPEERDRKDYIKARVFDPAIDSDDAVLQWLRDHQDHNLYYTANVAKPAKDWRGKRTDRPTRENLAQMICLHADVDPRAGEDVSSEQDRILKMLTAPKPKDLPEPTAIIFTGGGYQVLWRLAEPVDIKDAAHAEDLARYNLQIRNLLEGDSAQDLSRILRLPGTINWPNKLKREKKGRKPALTRIVEQHPKRVYPLKLFIQAPEIQSTDSVSARGKRPKRKSRVEVSDNIKRFDDINDLPDSVPDICKIVIVQGDNPDDFNQFAGDRSKAVWYVVCELVRNDVPDDDIFSIITDPGFGISAHVLDQPRAEKYALRQIERAHEHAEDPDLRELNDRFAVVTNYGGRCRVIEEVWNEAIHRSMISAYPFDDFRNSLMNRSKVLSDDKKMPLAEWWLRHDKRRQFDRVVFLPNEDEEVDGCYNLWRGFAVEPAPGDCSLFLTHLRTTICNDDEDAYLYLLRWMARCVQFPGEPGHIAIVLKGRMGTGKSTFADIFGRLFGRHYLQLADSKRLVNHFNNHLRDCVLLFADEAFYAGDKKHESVLKAMITERNLAIEAKGRDVEMSNNCLHIIMASNEDWAVPASIDDRRFCIFEIRDDKRNKHSYFQAIHDQMEAGGYGALLHMLLKMDLTGFNVRNRPETAALTTEKMLGLPPCEAYWYECLQSGSLGLLDSKNEGWPLIIPKRQLFDEVRRRFPNATRTFSNVRMGMTFAKIMPPEAQRDVRVSGTSIWRNSQGHEQQAVNTPGYQLPDLSACRKFWEERFGPPHQPWGVVEDVAVEDRSPF